MHTYKVKSKISEEFRPKYQIQQDIKEKSNAPKKEKQANSIDYKRKIQSRIENNEQNIGQGVHVTS